MTDVQPPRRAPHPLAITRDGVFVACLLASMGWLSVVMSLSLGSRQLAMLALVGVLLIPVAWCIGFVSVVCYVQRRRRPTIAAYPVPMHRHLALRPFSRGHQPILVYARELRRRAKSLDRRDLHSHRGALDGFRAYAAAGLEAHLRAEEEHLLSRLDGSDDPDLAAALAEYAIARADLRHAVAEVTEESPDGLRRLGDALENHARGCERGLFPIVERVLDERTLAELNIAIGAYQI